MPARLCSKLLITLIVAVILLMGVGAAAYAADLTTCGKCHDFVAKPNQDPAKFVLPVYNDHSQSGTVVNKGNCIACHLTNIGSIHSVKFLTVTVAMDGVTYGGFKAANSIYQPSSYIHPRHKTYRATNSTCQTCHGVVSCQTCHQPVAHEQHYLPQAKNPLTQKAIATPSIYVANGDIRQYVPTTCAASECHQALPAPKSTRTDGTDLCFNCHTTGTAGHTNAAAKHSSSFIPNPALNCIDCHQADLVSEHAARKDANGVAYNCFTCHQNTRTDVKAAIALKNSSCDACHTSFDHVTVHNSPTIDDKCGTCHKGNLVNEHLDNIKTQKNSLSCDTCHKSAKSDVQYTINLRKSTDCTLCHTAGHKMNFVSAVPADIPLYSDVEWSLPQVAAIWQTEAWYDEAYNDNGKRIVSSRSSDISVQQFRDYYVNEMANKGWSLDAEQLVSGTTILKFKAGQRIATVMIYNTDVPQGTEVVLAGYKVDILYK